MRTAPAEHLLRRVTRRTALVIAAIGIVWAATLLISGGFTFRIFGWLIRSRDPVRPFAVGALGVIAFFATGGRLRVAPLVYVGRLAFSGRLVQLGRTAHDRLAAGLALAMFVVGLLYATTAVGGADSYGYVSQADQWIQGEPKIDQPWVRKVPWPLPNWTFTPVGYRPSERSHEPSVLLPQYALDCRC